MERMEKRRCFSTSETSYVRVDAIVSDNSEAGSVISLDKQRNSISRLSVKTRMKLRTTSETLDEDRVTFSRGLSTTAERMMQARKLVNSKSTGSIFGGGRKSPPYLLLNAKNDLPTSVTTSCDTPRRVSLIVDELRQPIAVVQSFQDKVSVQPLGRQHNSLSRLLENPYGNNEPLETVLEEGPKISTVPDLCRVNQRDFSKPCSARHDQDFVKECQTKGEIIKKADYRLLNVTALFIIAVLITAIVFFSLWRDVSGEIWVMYCGLAFFIILVILALMGVRFHFYLKSRGFNLLCRQQRHTATFPRKPLEKIYEADVDVEKGTEDDV